MQITRSSIQTQKGPADWFTGDVYIDAIAAPAGTSTFTAAAVHFTPGARTAWPTHPHGQTIFVTEGLGLCQREGGEVEVIRAGGRVFFDPAESHCTARRPAASWSTSGYRHRWASTSLPKRLPNSGVLRGPRRTQSTRQN